jgi:hypothetical protein
MIRVTWRLLYAFVLCGYVWHLAVVQPLVLA